MKEFDEESFFKDVQKTIEHNKTTKIEKKEVVDVEQVEVHDNDQE